MPYGNTVSVLSFFVQVKHVDALRKTVNSAGLIRRKEKKEVQEARRLGGLRRKRESRSPVRTSLNPWTQWTGYDASY